MWLKTVLTLQRFPNGVDWWGKTIWTKWPKNCMKITKLAFLAQNSGGTWGGGKPIFQVVGGDPPSH